MKITIEMVKTLIDEQFPDWRHLPVEPVKNGGHDNRTFHLGKSMLVRLPSAACYEPQIEKEKDWLPYLSKHLHYRITKPIAVGRPSTIYPYMWSINEWLDGETVTQAYCQDERFARELAKALKQLQNIDVKNGPVAGVHNFYRGGDLRVYDIETRDAIKKLKGQIDEKKCQMIWQQALQSTWQREPVWVHGDVAIGNILVNDGRFVGLIDFGMLAIGDPACDLVMAWTFFDKTCQEAFREEMELDNDTWKRAMGWALWKALITYESDISKEIVKNIIA